jgi:hypothetical protein
MRLVARAPMPTCTQRDHSRCRQSLKSRCHFGIGGRDRRCLSATQSLVGTACRQ